MWSITNWENTRHLIKEVEVGDLVYIDPESCFKGGWAMVTKIRLTDEKTNLPEVVNVLYTYGSKDIADEFMITKLIKKTK